MARIQQNRKGFTLMEVLISIAIIGVVFMPILTFFSNSSQTNIRVKNIQRANTVAQSVMEEFRSYATIQDMTETYWNDEGTGDSRFMTDSSYQESSRPGEIFKSGVFDEKEDYYFLKTGIVCDDKSYAARIHVSPGEYSTLNGKELPVISSLGSETTVVAREEEETLDKIREYTRLHFNKTGVNLNVDYIASKIRKTMMVEITDTVTVEDGDTTKPEPVANGMVHVRVYNLYDLIPDSKIEGCDQAQVGRDIFDGLMEESQLEGIYVFYNYDITKANTQIMQGMKVLVDLKESHPNWNCNYTVYAVCQGVKEVDEDVFKTGKDMEQYIKDKNPCISLTATTNVNGSSYTDTPEDSGIAGKTPMIWTNMRCSNETVYPTQAMDDIVGKETIQRLSKLEVEIFDGKKDENTGEYKYDYSKPVASMTSTRGE